MLIRILSGLLLCLASLPSAAQLKAANYASGRPGTRDYEHLTFWTDRGRRSHIDYTYGADRREVRLAYAGRSGKGFKVVFPNKLVLTLVPSGRQLLVTGNNGQYRKTFSWAYEGPVNGIGTYCDVCTQNDREAMRLLQAAYLH